MSESCLTLSHASLPPFSARGCIQVLQPIQSPQAYRTVNGELITTPSKEHHKYKTMIKGKDKLPIALDTLWKGQDVIVGCIQSLWQKAETNTVVLQRMPVAGSIFAIDVQRNPIEIVAVQRQEVQLQGPGFVGYRPLLTMKLVDFGYEIEEWSNDDGLWFMKLEEV